MPNNDNIDITYTYAQFKQATTYSYFFTVEPSETHVKFYMNHKRIDHLAKYTRSLTKSKLFSFFCHFLCLNNYIN